MPRLARLVIPDVAMHVVQRGHDRKDCFREDTDRLVYLSNLRDLAAHTKCALHAYCLMTNHVHLLLTPSREDSCARLMRNLGQRYVQYFNRRYGRRGTLWEGRFHSCLVESAEYVLACYRYIERNPVRAQMVPSADAYAWSSHNGNTGQVPNKLLVPHVEYLALSDRESARRTAYRSLFQQPDDPAFLAVIREATYGGLPLVGKELKAKLAAETTHPLEHRKPGPKAQTAPQHDAITADLGF
jgi:putative transposase